MRLPCVSADVLRKLIVQRQKALHYIANQEIAIASEKPVLLIIVANGLASKWARGDSNLGPRDCEPDLVVKPEKPR